MNVSKQELINALAEKLKIMIKKPDWADFVKTGVFKQRPPMTADWWYMRAASILLKVDSLGPVGVSKLRTKYGGRKNRGVAPEHFYRGSGKIIRTLLQQMEVAGLLKQDKKDVHKGRVLTPKAKALIAQTGKTIEKPRQKLFVERPVEKREEPKKEEKTASEKLADSENKSILKKAEVKKEEPKKEEKKEEIKKESVPNQPVPNKAQEAAKVE